jgi:hypothetical protein
MTSHSDWGFAPGLPPDGAAGTFIGLDASGRLWLLAWHPRGEWNGLAYENPSWPVLKRGAELAARIVKHLRRDA